MDTEQTILCINRVLGIVLRRAGWIVLCVVLVAGAVYEYSSYVTE